jgi:c-di-GMP-binding flagellar brake protein YcgR
MIEKRKHLRFDMINPTRVEVFNDDILTRQGQGRTINISRGGALLETPFPIEKGRKLALVVNLEKEFVYISGSVAHTRCESDGCYKTGVMFMSIDDRGMAVLDKYIKLFSSQREKERGQKAPAAK